MFHLWRKRRSLALFPNQVLLMGGSDPAVLQPARAGNDALFAVFAEALLDAKRKSRRKIRMSLVVSDRLASIVALPWQDALIRVPEIDAYAHAQFERSGQALDERWTMFSYFRHYGASGLAYALPTDFVQRLREIATSHDVVIDSIMPLSAMAYARQARSKRGTTALVLRESCRVTALVAGRKGLMVYATEPVAGGLERSVERLLRRLHVEHELHVVQGFALEPGVEADMSELIARVLPSAKHSVADFDF